MLEAACGHPRDPDLLRQAAVLAAQLGVRLPFQEMYLYGVLALEGERLDLRGADFTRARIGGTAFCLWGPHLRAAPQPADLRGARFVEARFSEPMALDARLEPVKLLRREPHRVSSFSGWPTQSLEIRSSLMFLEWTRAWCGVDLRGAAFRDCKSDPNRIPWTPWHLTLARMDESTHIKGLGLDWFPPGVRARWRAFSWTAALLAGEAHPWMGPEPEGALVEDLPSLDRRPDGDPEWHQKPDLVALANAVLDGERPPPSPAEADRG